MRIIIFTSWGGTYAIPVLKSLFKEDVEIVTIFSQGIHWGRILEYHPSYYLNYKDNVSEMIAREGFKNHEIIRTANDDAIIDFVKDNNIDYIFTIAYGEILKKEIIDAPKKGVINFHSGLLPENQGADPIASVLMNNITETGISVHYIDEGIDTGDIILRKTIRRDTQDSYDSLQLKLGFATSKIIPELLDNLSNTKITALQQDSSKKKYYKKLDMDNGLFNFSMSSKAIDSLVKTFSGYYKKAYFEYQQYKIYVSNCEIIDHSHGYQASELVDQGLGYMVVGTSDGVVLLKNIIVDDLNDELSTQLLNNIFNKTVKNI